MGNYTHSKFRERLESSQNEDHSDLDTPEESKGRKGSTNMIKEDGKNSKLDRIKEDERFFNEDNESISNGIESI